LRIRYLHQNINDISTQTIAGTFSISSFIFLSMKKDFTTLKKLAELLKLSTSTISRALNNHPDISQATKDRVKNLALNLNYVPNFTAQSLRSSSSKTIGVIIPKLTIDHSSRIINGMIIQSRKMGYHLIISESGHDFKLEGEILTSMINSRVDGILMSMSNSTNNIDHIIEAKNKCPLVLYDKVSEKIACTQIIVDDEIGAYNAVMHLIDQKRKRIIYINGAKNSLSARKRYMGYLRALETSGIEKDENLIENCEDVGIEEGRRITQELINKNIIFDAIFAVTDDVAIGAIQVLKENNIRIPDQVAVVGFSNSKNATIIEPNLSSVDQHGLDNSD